MRARCWRPLFVGGVPPPAIDFGALPIVDDTLELLNLDLFDAAKDAFLAGEDTAPTLSGQETALRWRSPPPSIFERFKPCMSALVLERSIQSGRPSRA